MEGSSKEAFVQMDQLQIDSWNNGSPQDPDSVQDFIYDSLELSGCLQELHLDKSKLRAFLGAVTSTYNDLPFHNVMHIKDVVGRMAVMLSASGFYAIQRCALLIAAAVHDLDHFGMSNAELTASRHPVALRHPMSPLENHHLDCFMHLMSMPGLDFMTQCGWMLVVTNPPH